MVKDQVGGGRRVLKMENGEDGGKILGEVESKLHRRSTEKRPWSLTKYGDL